MYPGLPSRLEKEIKSLYLQRVLKGDSSKLAVHFNLKVFTHTFSRNSDARSKILQEESTWYSLVVLY